MGEAPRETVTLAFAAEVACCDLVAGGMPRLLGRSEVFAGRFTAGATRFEFDDGRAALASCAWCSTSCHGRCAGRSRRAAGTPRRWVSQVRDHPMFMATPNV